MFEHVQLVKMSSLQDSLSYLQAWVEAGRLDWIGLDWIMYEFGVSRLWAKLRVKKGFEIKSYFYLFPLWKGRVCLMGGMKRIDYLLNLKISAFIYLFFKCSRLGIVLLKQPFCSIHQP